MLEIDDIRECSEGVGDLGGNEDNDDNRWCWRISKPLEGEKALAGDRYPYPFDLLGVAGVDRVISDPWN